MMLTLTLAAGLMAAPAQQAEPQRGWIVELRGYMYHAQRLKVSPAQQAEPQKGWIVELRGYTYHGQQLKVQKQVEAVEAIYVDDLPAFFKKLKKQKP